MGNSGTKVHPSYLPGLVKTLTEVYLPDDRNIVYDTLDQIDALLLNKKAFEDSVKLCKELGLFYVLIKAVKKLADDIEIVSLLVQILESVRFDTPLVMDFIQFGGFDLIEKIQKLHASDQFLTVSLPKILKSLHLVGARASIAVIENEGAHLQLCQCCQLILERQKHPFGSVASKSKVTLPSSSDRANKVCRFMDNFISNIGVQVAGLDALLHFVHNADAPVAVRSTDMLEVVVKVVLTHKTVPGIVWRACSVLGVVASFGMEVAVKIAITHIHEELIDVYGTYTALPIVQLHILRMYGNMLSHVKVYVLIHKSQKCVDFLKEVVENMTKAREREEEERRELEKQKLAKKGVRDMLKKAAPSPAPPPAPAQPTGAAATTAPQQVLPLPYQITKFVRETGGKVYRAKSAPKANKSKDPAKQRRNFDERPKFGTIDDRIFVSGEQGLIAVPGEEEDDDAKTRKTWEKHLQYGETKQM